MHLNASSYDGLVHLHGVYQPGAAQYEVIALTDDETNPRQVAAALRMLAHAIEQHGGWNEVTVVMKTDGSAAEVDEAELNPEYQKCEHSQSIPFGACPKCDRPPTENNWPYEKDVANPPIPRAGAAGGRKILASQIRGLMARCAHAKLLEGDDATAAIDWLCQVFELKVEDPARPFTVSLLQEMLGQLSAPQVTQVAQKLDQIAAAEAECKNRVVAMRNALEVIEHNTYALNREWMTQLMRYGRDFPKEFDHQWIGEFISNLETNIAEARQVYDAWQPLRSRTN
jgi:hypothetical protein